MPELPEVETIARALRPELTGRKIVSVRLLWARTLATPSVAVFEKTIVGLSFVKIGRGAKYLQLELSSSNLFIHLRMSGDLAVKGNGYLPDKHDRLHLGLSDGGLLVFNDTRKFGRIWLVADPQEVIGGPGPAPPDPTFFVQQLYLLFQRRPTQTKTNP